MRQTISEQSPLEQMLRHNAYINKGSAHYNSLFNEPSPQNNCHPSVVIASMRTKPEEILCEGIDKTNLKRYYYREAGFM